jgi:hypothetical protein
VSRSTNCIGFSPHDRMQMTRHSPMVTRATVYLNLLLEARGKKKKLSLESDDCQSASRTDQACTIHDENAGVAPTDKTKPEDNPIYRH